MAPLLRDVQGGFRVDAPEPGHPVGAPGPAKASERRSRCAARSARLDGRRPVARVLRGQGEPRRGRSRREGRACHARGPTAPWDQESAQAPARGPHRGGEKAGASPIHRTGPQGPALTAAAPNHVAAREAGAPVGEHCDVRAGGREPGLPPGSHSPVVMRRSTAARRKSSSTESRGRGPPTGPTTCPRRGRGHAGTGRGVRWTAASSPRGRGRPGSRGRWRSSAPSMPAMPGTSGMGGPGICIDAAASARLATRPAAQSLCPHPWPLPHRPRSIRGASRSTGRAVPAGESREPQAPVSCARSDPGSAPSRHWAHSAATTRMGP